MHRLIWCIFFCTLCSIWTCQKADLSDIDNLRNNEIGIIGHGGMGFPSPQVNLPSNSLEGITKAIEGYQADGVEVDVQLSQDGVLFLYHDSRLQSLMDCVGCLYQYEAETLDECRYVSGFNTRFFNDQRLVRLETIIKRFDERAIKPYVFLDLKTSLDCPYTFDYRSFEDLFIASLKDIYTKYNCEDWVIVESGDIALLQRIQTEIPDIRLNFFTALSESSIATATEQEFFGLSANFDQATKNFVDMAHDQGLFVTLGILRIRRDAIDMIEKNADFIYTDNIPLLQSILQ